MCFSVAVSGWSNLDAGPRRAARYRRVGCTATEQAAGNNRAAEMAG
jgi:hypothetical protein